MKEYYTLLTACPLFKQFMPKQIAASLSALKAETKAYKKGQLIFSAWEPAVSVGIILKGTALVTKLDYDGNRNILTKLQPPDLFGEVFACLDMPTLPVSVEATTNCTILFINFKNLFQPPGKYDIRPHALPEPPAAQESLFALRQQMISNMLKIIASKNLLLNKKITIMSQHTTQKKLLTFLHRQAEEQGSQTFTIDLDRQALADYLGVERSAMSAELSKLQKMGKITFHKNQFTVK